MLDTTIKEQLRTYLERLVTPIELIATLNEQPQSVELEQLLHDIASLSDKVSVRTDGDDERAPSFWVGRSGEPARICFAGIPTGHEFTSLVLALLQTGGHPPRITEMQTQQIRSLNRNLNFVTYVSLSCHNCPDVVQALNTMAVLNPGIRHTMVDGAIYPQEVDRLQIMAVPSVWLNGERFSDGRMSLDELLAGLIKDDEVQNSEQLSDKAPFDVLVVGGGPAGAAAAVYAARKGIRTGLLAERFGGQVMDTLDIENLISILHTEGPRLGRAFEEHVRSYEVDIMSMHRAKALVPGQNGGPHTLELDHGQKLSARTIILATGARWRELNVPGEQEFRGRGVAYCPHCDGPLFKGKRVAVIGGGNSGAEAAIDLAGLVAHVTLLEFADTLRADAVLQNKLHSLPNVTMITSAQTTEVFGDNNRVSALGYKDRNTSQLHRLELEGVFVQIGLLPNTDWLKGILQLSRFGEIEIDAHGATSLPGVFAAGDCTTVPYKQIVIAIGEGAKASLAAFDYLIRQSPA